MISQQEALIAYLPMIATGAKYEKFTEVLARPAKEGESITTVTAAGTETKNTAKPGDYIVQNLTKAKEQYILPAAKFQARYLLITASYEDGWTRYKATGEIQAYAYQGPNTEFTAPWGEGMQLHTGDMLCTPLPQGGEVYRIAKQEFGETYRLKTT